MTARARIAIVAALAAVTACHQGGDGATACRRSAPTADGPGDVSNHFPLSVGSRWLYDQTTLDAGATPVPSRWRAEVTGTRQVGGTTASVLVATSEDGRSPPEEALFAKGPSGVTELAGTDVAPPLDRLYPYQLVTFPLAAGRTFEQVSCEGLDFGADLDGDGKHERIDVRSVVTVEGEETVATPAGTFATVRVQTVATTTLRATSGQTATASVLEVDWLAPGVGRVRTTTSVSDGTSTSTTDTLLVGFDVEGRRGGVTASATLAAGLAYPDSNTEMPGRPALSFDGAGHLLVTPANPTGAWMQQTLRAVILAADGSPVAAFDLLDRKGEGAHPAAAFNGTSHLVASNLQVDADSSTIFAQRVTPAGERLDGPSGFVVTSGGDTTYPPAVASDGDGWLVVWTRFRGGLEGARISSAGEVLGTLALRGPGPGPALAVAHGGGVYLVAWVEGDGVLALRVKPDGTVLDASPIAISTSPGAKELGGVAWDGARFLVAWGDARRGATSMNGPAFDVWAARILADGTLLDGPPDTGGLPVNVFLGNTKLDPAVAFDGEGFVVTWWIDGYAGLVGEVGVFAARVTGDGRVLDGPTAGMGFPVARPASSRYVHPLPVRAGEGEALVAWSCEADPGGAGKSIMGARLAR